jgi:hypothetical protein
MICFIFQYKLGGPMMDGVKLVLIFYNKVAFRECFSYFNGSKTNRAG